jgi:hypothetical protein
MQSSSRQSCLKRSQRFSSCGCACATIPQHVSCKGQHAIKLLQKGIDAPDASLRAMYSIFSSPLGLISKFGRYADAYAPLPLASATHSHFAAVLSCRNSRRCCSASFSTISSLVMPHNPSKRISFPQRATCEQQIWFATATKLFHHQWSHATNLPVSSASLVQPRPPPLPLPSSPQHQRFHARAHCTSPSLACACVTCPCMHMCHLPLHIYMFCRGCERQLPHMLAFHAN